MFREFARKEKQISMEGVEDLERVVYISERMSCKFTEDDEKLS